jgi:hypothetical protein
MRISGTSIQSWQRCQRAFFFRDENAGLGYTTAKDSEAIQMGNWGHYTLGLVQRGFSYDRAIALAFERQLELWQQFGVVFAEEEYIARCIKFTNLMLAHEQWQEQDASRYADKNLQVIYTEHNFRIEYEGHTITGQWDALVKHKQTGEHFIFERKITKYPDQLELAVQWDLQPRLYTWAAQRLLGEDIRVTGILYEFIRNCDPTQGKILKSGYPSKAKTELDSTTYEVYRSLLSECAVAQGVNLVGLINDYQDQLDYLKNKARPIFRRTVLVVPQSHMDMAARTALTTAHEIEEAQPYPPVPSLSRYQCASQFTPCAFRDVCLAMDDGVDWLGMLDNEFVRGKPHFDETLNEEML